MFENLKWMTRIHAYGGTVCCSDAKKVCLVVADSFRV